jgi:hypothetical protein
MFSYEGVIACLLGSDSYTWTEVQRSYGGRQETVNAGRSTYERSLSESVFGCAFRLDVNGQLMPG